MKNFKRKAKIFCKNWKKKLGNQAQSFKRFIGKVIRLKRTKGKLVSWRERIKRSQKIVMAVIGVLIITGLFLVFKDELFPTKKQVVKRKTHQVSSTKSFNELGVQLKPNETFQMQTQEKDKKQDQEIAKTRDIVADLQKSTKGFKPDEVRTLRKEVNELKKLVSLGIQGKSINQGKAINRVEIDLVTTKSKEIPTVDNTIPAGSFARGILRMGVEADAGVGSQSNPEVVTIEITSPGNLPRRFKSDLEGCRVIAEGYGHLGKERIIFRLNKLSCTERATGEIVVTEVAGIITGEDGISGLRGKVIDRSADHMKNVAIASIIGGFSNLLSPQEGTAPYISLTTPKAPSLVDRFQRGATNGISNAAERFTNRYLDVVDLLNPVIAISGGRVVDISFTENAQIGSTRVKQEIAKKRNAKREEIARKVAEQDNFKRFGGK